MSRSSPSSRSGGARTKSPASATPLATQNLQQHLQQRISASSPSGGMEAASSGGAARATTAAGEFAEERKDGEDSPLLLSSSEDGSGGGLNVMRMALRHRQQFGLLDDDDGDDDITMIGDDIDVSVEEETPSRRSKGTRKPTKRTTTPHEVGTRPASSSRRTGAVSARADLDADDPESLMSVVHALRRERSITARKHQEEVSRLQKAIAVIEKKAMREVKEISQRQKLIESTAGGRGAAAEQAREALRDLPISEARYGELKAMKATQRSYVDFVRMRVHEEVAASKKELEALRVDAANATEESTRHRADASRLRRELDAAAREVAELRLERERSAEAATARETTISGELDAAKKAAALLRDKAGRSDELRASLNDAETRFRDVSASLTSARHDAERMRRRVEEMEEERKTAQHAAELLTMDKSYLQREVDALGDRCSRSEKETDELRQKVTELKRQRQELHDRILNDHNSSTASAESRIQAEVSRIQSAAKEDIERIRVENLAAHEREVAALKDMRDAGAGEVKRLQSELRESRRSYEDLLLRFREAQKDADVHQAELLTDVKMKAFELERLRVLADESVSGARQGEHEREMLRDKVKVLAESYQKLDAEMSRQVHELEAKCSTQESQLRHYEMLEREIDEAVLASSSSSTPSTSLAAADGGTRLGLLEGIGASLPISVRRRVQQSIALSRRCKELEIKLEKAESERDALRREAQKAKIDAERLERRLESVQQPYTLIIKSIRETEEKAEAAQKRCTELETALAHADEEKARMREDMEELVNDRSAMLLLQEEMNAEFAAAAATAAAEAVAASASITSARDTLGTVVKPKAPRHVVVAPVS